MLLFSPVSISGCPRQSLSAQPARRVPSEHCLLSLVSECEACPKDTERANCPALAGLQIAKLAHRVVPNEEVVRKSP